MEEKQGEVRSSPFFLLFFFDLTGGFSGDAWGGMEVWHCMA